MADTPRLTTQEIESGLSRVRPRYSTGVLQLSPPYWLEDLRWCIRAITDALEQSAAHAAEIQRLTAERDTFQQQITVLKAPLQPAYYAEALDLCEEMIVRAPMEKVEEKAPKIAATLRHAAHQLRRLEARETALRALVTQWRAEADRSKLLQGLKCADELAALLDGGDCP